MTRRRPDCWNRPAFKAGYFALVEKRTPAGHVVVVSERISSPWANDHCKTYGDPVLQPSRDCTGCRWIPRTDQEVNHDAV